VRESRDQFRLGGTLAVVGADAGAADAEARRAAWGRLSPSAREWNAGPEPGAVKVEGEGAATTSAAAAAVRGGGDGGAAADASASPPPPHPHFGLMLLDIDFVDHVDLEGDRRWQHRRGAGGAWTTVEVNP
jgi:hypothetical protein